MKTRVKNIVLSMALVLGVLTLNANPSLLNTVSENTSDATSGLEEWMTNTALFAVAIDDATGETIVDIAVGNSDFSILVEAVTKADLAGALSEEGPFTVFAPTNEAFLALFSQLEIEGIEDLTVEQLVPILTYHVVPGKVFSSDLSNTTVATLNSNNVLTIDISDGVKVNESNVVMADLEGTNGVIHVVDKVLIPE